ncbi:MAG: YadA-like family protein [Alphaproteobacteria bacterium]|nr:YadA-like family protein [Alphaproteobacteria bacterium]
MKKLMLTSILSMVVGTAGATTYIGNPGTGTADWANWLEKMPGETAAAVNNLAVAVNDNAKTMDDMNNVMAGWNKHLFGENGDMTEGLFYSYYKKDGGVQNRLNSLEESAAAVSDVNAELVKTNETLTQTNTALSALNKEVENTNAHFNKELGATNDTLKKTNDALSALNTEVENTNEHFNTELTKTNDTLALHSDAISRLNDAIALSGGAFVDDIKADVSRLSDKVSDMSKELSAGIANVAALSAVAVSDVKRGEVSFGGGYGYHNSQSAVAFGTAVGLTDNWSMNAGLGFNDYDVTVRAGTNIKFKLF